MKVHENVLSLIGNTPLVKLHKVSDGAKPLMFAKLEYLNPGGSVKDRIGPAMVEDAEKKGQLKPGGTIVEGTSGNTGVGLALAAALKGYRTVFTMNDKQSREKQLLLKSFGARVVVCPTAVAPDDPRSYYSVAKKIHAETPNSVYPNQYENQANPEVHYHTTGPEIWRDTEGKVTHYFVATGTGGTISGAGKFLKEKNPDVKVVAIDPEGSILKEYKETGEYRPDHAYSYKVEGFGEDIIPAVTWFEHIGAIRWKTKLTPRLREIAIVRVAQAARYAYALNQHVPTIAVPDGVSLEECEALKDWRASKFFNEAERAALAYVDAMIAGPEVPDDVFNAVRKHYTEREIVELTVLVGTYLMHNRVFTALRVDVEPKKN